MTGHVTHHGGSFGGSEVGVDHLRQVVRHLVVVLDRSSGRRRRRGDGGVILLEAVWKLVRLLT